jgi:hypothetical protein
VDISFKDDVTVISLGTSVMLNLEYLLEVVFHRGEMNDVDNLQFLLRVFLLCHNLPERLHTVIINDHHTVKKEREFIRDPMESQL